MSVSAPPPEIVSGKNAQLMSGFRTYVLPGALSPKEVRNTVRFWRNTSVGFGEFTDIRGVTFYPKMRFSSLRKAEDWLSRKVADTGNRTSAVVWNIDGLSDVWVVGKYGMFLEVKNWSLQRNYRQ